MVRKMRFQEPMNRGWMVSLTSMLPSGKTWISTSKRWMMSSRAVAGAAAVSSRRRISRARRAMAASSLELARAGGTAAEAHPRGFALRRFGQLEELPRLEGEQVGDEVGGEHGDAGVEVAHHGVVVAASVLDGLFNLGELALQLGEALHRAQLRVGLGQSEKLTQSRGQHPFCRPFFLP